VKSALYGESELDGMEERSITRGRSIARNGMSMKLLAANAVDTWIGKGPRRILYYCTRSQTRISQAIIQKRDYQHEYFFILDNGLNQPVHGDILFK